MKTKPQSLIAFPCSYPIKVIGSAAPDFEACVVKAIALQLPNFTSDCIQRRASKRGNYVALSATLEVTSQKQLDDIYQALTDTPQVMMVL